MYITHGNTKIYNPTNESLAELGFNEQESAEIMARVEEWKSTQSQQSQQSQ